MKLKITIKNQSDEIKIQLILFLSFKSYEKIILILFNCLSENFKLSENAKTVVCNINKF